MSKENKAPFKPLLPQGQTISTPQYENLVADWGVIEALLGFYASDDNLPKLFNYPNGRKYKYHLQKLNNDLLALIELENFKKTISQKSLYQSITDAQTVMMIAACIQIARIEIDIQRRLQKQQELTRSIEIINLKNDINEKKKIIKSTKNQNFQFHEILNSLDKKAHPHAKKFLKNLNSAVPFTTHNSRAELTNYLFSIITSVGRSTSTILFNLFRHVYETMKYFLLIPPVVGMLVTLTYQGISAARAFVLHKKPARKSLTVATVIFVATIFTLSAVFASFSDIIIAGLLGIGFIVDGMLPYLAARKALHTKIKEMDFFKTRAAHNIQGLTNLDRMILMRKLESEWVKPNADKNNLLSLKKLIKKESLATIESELQQNKYFQTIIKASSVTAFIRNTATKITNSVIFKNEYIALKNQAASKRNMCINYSLVLASAIMLAIPILPVQIVGAVFLSLSSVTALCVRYQLINKIRNYFSKPKTEINPPNTKDKNKLSSTKILNFTGIQRPSIDEEEVYNVEPVKPDLLPPQPLISATAIPPMMGMGFTQ